MRIGVIRGDLPGSVELTDLETISQYNPPIEPSGQEIHIGRPSPTTVGNLLATVPPTLASTAGLTFPVVINAGNKVLLVKTSSAATYTTATLATSPVAAAATGSITAVAKASLVDGETFTLNDGTNTPTIFEFDVAGNGVTAGHTIVDVSGGGVVTANDVAVVMRAAINGVIGGLAITAGAPTLGVMALTNDATGAAGNQAITKTVANVGFTVTGMSGGVTAGYLTMTTLLSAINAALTTAAVSVVASADSGGTKVILTSGTPGVGSFIGIDTVAHGSTINTILSLTDGGSFTVPTAAATITALLPVGGPLDVSSATIITNLGNSAAALGVADVIAPKLIETQVVLESFLSGSIHGYKSASFCPNPYGVSALPAGAAISVVQDDGTSAYVLTMPTISGAVHASPGSGYVTITGTNLGDSENMDTKVKVVLAATGQSYTFPQKLIVSKSGGVVTATSIVLPNTLLGIAVGVGDTVTVKYLSYASNTFTVT